MAPSNMWTLKTTGVIVVMASSSLPFLLHSPAGSGDKI